MEETTFQSNNSHDLTKSVTDFVFSSLPSDDVDMPEAHDIFEGVHAHNVTVPSMQEESLFPNHLDSDLTFVVSVKNRGRDLVTRARCLCSGLYSFEAYWKSIDVRLVPKIVCTMDTRQSRF